jgi:DNA ligase-1
MKREFLTKAHNLSCNKGTKTLLGGWLLSEKFDGIRCFWDGGVSRGQPKASVPWANTTKDARYKQEQIATGLWSYYGNVIHAPDWWLDELPKHFLDGELWIGRGEGERQRLTKIVKKLVPNMYEWRDVQYLLFDSPPLERVFETGQINNPHFQKHIDLAICKRFIEASGVELCWICGPNAPFSSRLIRMKLEHTGGVSRIIDQTALPNGHEASREALQSALTDVLANQGEGVVVRSPNGIWEPRRVYSIFKVKDIKTAEAVVVGYTSGRQTDKGSKLLGKMGSLLCKMPDGKRFGLSGFTDAERQLTAEATAWAAEHPDQEIPTDEFGDACIACPLGTTITYSYRELTADGYPSEARYMRKRLVGLE